MLMLFEFAYNFEFAFLYLCRILQLNCIHTTYVRQGPEQRQQLEPDDKEDSESTYGVQC
jgi:hypothetical protein